jgi:hypothetical protein
MLGVSRQFISGYIGQKFPELGGSDGDGFGVAHQEIGDDPVNQYINTRTNFRP